MRIDWRSSGGRGEYELAGSAAGRAAADLLHWTLELSLGELGWHQTELMVSDQGGKPRLRRAGNLYHIQRQLSSALLLPTSRRSDENLARGSPVMIDRRYLIQSVSLNDIDLDAGMQNIKARVDTITVSNIDRSETIDIGERSLSIRILHDRHNELPDTLASLLASHRESLDAGAPIGREGDGLQLFPKAGSDPFCHVYCDGVAASMISSRVEFVQILRTLLGNRPIVWKSLQSLRLKRREAPHTTLRI